MILICPKCEKRFSFTIGQKKICPRCGFRIGRTDPNGTIEAKLETALRNYFGNQQDISLREVVYFTHTKTPLHFKLDEVIRNKTGYTIEGVLVRKINDVPYKIIFEENITLPFYKVYTQNEILHFLLSLEEKARGLTKRK